MSRNGVFHFEVSANKKKGKVFLTAKLLANGKTAGLVSGRFLSSPDKILLERFWVSPEFASMLEPELMDHFERTARAMKRAILLVEATENQKGTYEKLDFRVLQNRNGFYQMQKDIPPTQPAA